MNNKIQLNCKQFHLKDDDIVIVCAECLRACCWHGEFMCDNARDADIVEKTVAELKELGYENEEHW